MQNAKGKSIIIKLLVLQTLRCVRDADFSKCDELQLACDTCSSRGEPCHYPSPRIFTKKQPSSRREKTGSYDASLSTDSLAVSDKDSPFETIQLAAINATLPAIFSIQFPQGHGDLTMDYLKLLQFYHLHTADKMTLHNRKIMVWKRIIPDLASKNGYLIHLLLALAGIHMIIHQNEVVSTSRNDEIDTVDLTVIVEHHQIGL